MLSPDRPVGGSPRVLFVSLFNDVGSDRIVAAMGKLGARCAVMSAPDAFAAQTRFAERIFPLPRHGGSWVRGLRLGRRLARATRDFAPDLVVPLDEISARSLRDPKLYRRAGARVRAMLSASLGDPGNFALLCNRHRLVEEAKSLGIATPTQIAVTDLATAQAAAARLGYPVVLKREQTCGGAGVAILDGADALADAFRRADARAKAKRRLQRLLGREVTAEAPLVLQRHVAGALAFHVAACKDGRVLDGVSFISERVHPPVTGASTMLRPLARPDMDAAAVALVEALGCSGLVSLDFILPEGGEAVFIEMNPRPVASGHLGQLFGHDIYAALLDTAGATPSPRAYAPAEAPARIALFPRELDRDPGGTLACATPGVLHDVPWDDPAVVDAHAAWLARRHPGEAVPLATLLGRQPHEPAAESGAGTVARALARALGRAFVLRGAASAK